MIPTVSFVRGPTEGCIPRHLFVPEARPFHRPVQRTRLHLRDPQDVEAARRAGAAIYLLRSETVTMLGYPISFPPVLFAAEPTFSGIDSDLRTVVMVSDQAVREPRLEDVIVMLLHVDELASRAVAERNREDIRANYLLKRVLQEDLERAATLVRLQDFAPAIESVGRSLPRAALRRQMRKNLPRGILP